MLDFKDMKNNDALSADIQVAKPNKKALVVRRNDLIFGSLKLSLQEMRLFLWLVSEVGKDDEDFKRYRIAVSDFCELVGLEGQDLYGRMSEITGNMIKRVVKLHDIDEKVLRQRPLVSAADYRYGEGFVELELHRDLKPYLLNLKEQFSQINLETAIRLKSFYSIRLYEILKAEEYKGPTMRIAVAELRRLMGVEVDQYDRWDNFKARVLEPASKELNNRTELAVKYTAERKGHSVDQIVFNVANRGKSIGYSAGTRKDKLFGQLRAIGMHEAEAMRAIETWADEDVGRIEYHIDECKTKNNPLGWLRSGLKKDFRQQRSLFAAVAEMKKKAAKTRADYKSGLGSTLDGELKEGLANLYSELGTK